MESVKGKIEEKGRRGGEGRKPSLDRVDYAWRWRGWEAEEGNGDGIVERIDRFLFIYF